METVVQTQLVDRGVSKYLVALMPSSTPGKFYRTDVTNGRCDCPAWKFTKLINGQRKPCKHLLALGFQPLVGEPIKASKPKVESTPLPVMPQAWYDAL